jgi:microcin C transport system ATP-binding protein
MIAMALAGRPKLLIADEPTTALDVTIQAQILALLDALQAEMGLALLFITHDLNLVRRFTHRVGVMERGRLVETGPTEQVFAAPQHPTRSGCSRAGRAAWCSRSPPTRRA